MKNLTCPPAFRGPDRCHDPRFLEPILPGRCPSSGLRCIGVYPLPGRVALHQGGRLPSFVSHSLHPLAVRLAVPVPAPQCGVAGILELGTMRKGFNVSTGQQCVQPSDVAVGVEGVRPKGVRVGEPATQGSCAPQSAAVLRRTVGDPQHARGIQHLAHRNRRLPSVIPILHPRARRLLGKSGPDAFAIVGVGLETLIHRSGVKRLRRAMPFTSPEPAGLPLGNVLESVGWKRGGPVGFARRPGKCRALRSRGAARRRGPDSLRGRARRCGCLRCRRLRMVPRPGIEPGSSV